MRSLQLNWFNCESLPINLISFIDASKTLFFAVESFSTFRVRVFNIFIHCSMSFKHAFSEAFALFGWLAGDTFLRRCLYLSSALICPSARVGDVTRTLLSLRDDVSSTRAFWPETPYLPINTGVICSCFASTAFSVFCFQFKYRHISVIEVN